jgi:hypothetical protein
MPPISKSLTTDIIDLQTVQQQKSEEDERFELEEGATSLKFLQAVYRSSKVALSTRMRAAGMALQFEHPKLAVSANVPWDAEFGFRLDQAIQRSGTTPKLIEHQPTPPPQATPASNGSKPMVPDRRYRR